MNRSGIKRGLAVSAVAALGVVGIPGIAHAAAYSGPVTNAYSISVAEDPTSVSTDENSSVTITAKDVNGVAATGDLTVTFSEAATTADTTGTDPIKYNGTNETDTNTADKTWDGTETVPLVDGKATFNLTSDQAGTVSIKATGYDANGNLEASGNGSLTVGGGTTGNDAVKSLKLSDSNVQAYTGDSYTEEITPVDANGFGVAGATVMRSVNGGTATAVGTTAPGNYTIDDTLPSDPGSYTVQYWVNQSTGNNTPAADAGEPQGTVTETVKTAPSVHADTTYGANGFSSSAVTMVDDDNDPTTPDVAEIPTDTTTVPITAKVLSSDAATLNKPAAGIQVGFDVTIKNSGGTVLGTVKRYTATTDSNGLATVNVPVTAAQAAAGDTVSARLEESTSTAPGNGTQLIANTTVGTFAARTPQVKIAGNNGVNTLQATKGSQVNVPLVVSDQYGKTYANQTLLVTVTGGRNNTTSPVQLSTDANGQATYTYTDKGATPTGTDTITVDDASIPGTDDEGTFTVRYQLSTTPSTLTFSSEPNTGETNQVSTKAQDTYTVYVSNAEGALINSPVTFTVDNGFVTDTANGTGSSKSVTVYTNGAGKATAYAGSTTPGSQTLTATDGTAPAVTGNKVTYNAGSAYALTLTPASGAVLQTGTAEKFTALVTDAYGNPLPAQTVDFSQSGVGSLGSGVSNVQGLTGLDGSVSVTLNTGDAAGSGYVGATDDDWAGGAYPSANSDATVSRSTAPAVSTYTVTAPTPPNPPKPPTKAAPKIWNFWGKSKGHRDILTVRASHANGKRMNLTRGGKVIAHGAVRGGKIVFRVRDINGNKKAVRYVAKIAHSRKATRVF